VVVDRGSRRPVSGWARAAGLVWSLPATLIGLLVAPLFPARRRRDGALVCEGGAWLRRLGWRYSAITFGHVILCAGEIDDATLAHELVHVAQYDRLGIFFFPAYGLASLGALIRGGHHYKDNRFERAARLQARR